MGVSVNGSGNGEDNSKKGLEGTGLALPINRHANLISASSDDDFTDILAGIKSSKTPVSIPNSYHQKKKEHHRPFYFLGFHFKTQQQKPSPHNLLFCLVLCLISYGRYVFDSCVLQNCLQAVINYGASW